MRTKAPNSFPIAGSPGRARPERGKAFMLAAVAGAIDGGTGEEIEAYLDMLLD